MILDIPTPRTAIVLELAPHRPERIAQRDEGIHVRGRSAARMANSDHLVGKTDIDVEVIQGAVPVVTRRRRDDDVAVGNARIEFLETRHQSSDSALERRRVVEVTESDL
jgi:hypothetical protein